MMCVQGEGIKKPMFRLFILFDPTPEFIWFFRQPDSPVARALNCSLCPDKIKITGSGLLSIWIVRLHLHSRQLNLRSCIQKSKKIHTWCIRPFQKIFLPSVNQVYIAANVQFLIWQSPHKSLCTPNWSPLDIPRLFFGDWLVSITPISNNEIHRKTLKYNFLCFVNAHSKPKKKKIAPPFLTILNKMK